MIRFAQSNVKLADCSIRVAGNVFIGENLPPLTT